MSRAERAKLAAVRIEGFEGGTGAAELKEGGAGLVRAVLCMPTGCMRNKLGKSPGPTHEPLTLLSGAFQAATTKLAVAPHTRKDARSNIIIH